MAAASAGNHLSSSSSSSAANKPFNFSPDSPPQLHLSPDQLRHCTDALRAFKDKLQTPQEIRKEFRSLQSNRTRVLDMKSSCSVALDSVNYSKNRYTDILPFDRNRVVLNPCNDYRASARGYINASFIETSSSGSISRFIATQGPLPHTFEDFWEMISQYRCPVIVVLTRLVDNHNVLNCMEFKVIFKVALYSSTGISSYFGFANLSINTNGMIHLDGTTSLVINIRRWSMHSTHTSV
ncbi:protein-tyrosine-phosphatase PTP1-like isoform X3 [Rhododendron vialii]|uniref:protein-tyrosine-phosphatase PTP1-like isoform X3 n=1 Tax=Rhododendron vialii TaxID=182163 RepID=UPI00265E740A|nr:protein-tyrosine-phosphatase PTP1-like isoform X3 [Rhododendron vialii]